MKSILTLILLFAAVMVHADSDVTTEKAVAQTSFPTEWESVSGAQTVSLPVIPQITGSNTYNIKDYGAATTSSDNTAAIQAALNAVPKTGGMVVIPAGTWLCGAITVNAKTVLHLAAGATLKQLAYGVFDGGQKTGSFNHFITVSSSDVIIEGESQQTSILEGQGEPWWRAVEEKVDFKRGSMIRFTNGQRYLVRNLRTQNSPGTNITLGQGGKASHMTVHDVTISNPSSVSSNPSHNTDGIPVWGPYVNIYDCTISTGDDNIVCDSYSQFVHAWNIVCGAGHGMSIGSYTEKLHHIVYEGVTFNNTETGFRIKSSRGRSGNDRSGTSSNGSVSDIIMRNSTMTGVLQPIMLTQMYDDDKKDASTVTSAAVTYQTPEFCNILFQNITSTGTAKNSNFKYGAPIYIYGLPESYIHDITFDNVKVSAQKGMFLAYCKDIRFINGSTIVNAADKSKPVGYSYKATIVGDPTDIVMTQAVTDAPSARRVKIMHNRRLMIGPYNAVGARVNQ